MQARARLARRALVPPLETPRQKCTLSLRARHFQRTSRMPVMGGMLRYNVVPVELKAWTHLPPGPAWTLMLSGYSKAGSVDCVHPSTPTMVLSAMYADDSKSRVWENAFPAFRPTRPIAASSARRFNAGIPTVPLLAIPTRTELRGPTTRALVLSF